MAAATPPWTLESVPQEAPEAKERTLPSGRSVIVKVAGGREELEVRSPAGEIEVRITLSDVGPVVHLRGARLELDSLQAVAINCERFEVCATEGATLKSAGEVQIAGHEMRVQTRK